MRWLMVVGVLLAGCGSNWSEAEACQEYHRAQCDCGVYDEGDNRCDESVIVDQCSSLSSEEGSDEQQDYDECAIDGYRESCEWGDIEADCCEQHPGAADCG